MNIKTKRVIKGIAKTTGKYTLKGLGKGVELTSRGAIKTVNALVRNPQIQKLATGAGMIAASVMIPEIGVGMISTLALKYMIDNSILKKNKGVLSEVKDVMRVGNVVTKNVSNKILSPVLKSMDKGVYNLGKNYQNKIDDMFR